ncbi:winged helix-turn-helix transcriptional regulator [Ensifer sp. 22564]|uniref:winged helix-turn-helix transcriptional regulator n=1 Tax=Ensifer sp. 22564 TaxID=3453943 RepID=UPI003F86D73E
MKAQRTKPLVLICSDNADLFMLLAYILAREGFGTALVGEDEVIEQALAKRATAIILDSARDAELTLKTCTAIKTSDTTSRIPTIALVASGDERYFLSLLRAGVDENFIRPVSPARLLAYLLSLVQGDTNARRLTAERGAEIAFGIFRMEAERRTVVYGNEQVQLGPIEFKILRCMLEKPGRVFSRLELIDAVWPPTLYVQPRTVDVHVGHLRRSLHRLAGRTFIRTVRSSGYAIEMEECSA